MIANEADARAFVGEYADKAGMARLSSFADLLIEENARQNLVSASSLAEVWRRHFADSVQLLAYVPRETANILDAGGIWLDLGTGAGFPGLIIAALRPQWDVRLVESRRKRIEWLDTACSKLELPRCQVLGSRIEITSDFQASVISARAFAPLHRLLDLSTRFSTNRTLWLLPKGRSAVQELALLHESKRKLFHVEPSRTDAEAGIIIGRLDSSEQGLKRGVES